MGWSGNHNRAEYIAKMMKGWTCPTGEKVTVRKHHASGVEDWLILDVENPDGTKGAFISMMVWDGGMVKHMDETAFPYYYGCPVEWLDEVPCPDSEMASDWRMQLKGTPVHRCESCHELGCAGHALELVVLSAWGGRVNGGYASPMQYFLVKKEEYQARGRMFVGSEDAIQGLPRPKGEMVMPRDYPSGPWHREDSKSFYVFAPDGTVVANCVTLATAKLVEAAPELAEMLVSMLVHVSHGGPTREECEALLKKAGVM